MPHRTPTIFPGIRYAGRLASDPPNDLGQGEATMFTGAGSQTGTNGRWGDYSMTTIDPTDSMTFWTVGEYYANTSAFNWHTRIGKFNFQGGGQSPTPTPTATPASCSWAAGPSMPSVGPFGQLAFTSQLTASFTPWADAAPTQSAANSLTRLNMIRPLTLDHQVCHLSRHAYKQHGLWRAN